MIRSMAGTVLEGFHFLLDAQLLFLQFRKADVIRQGARKFLSNDLFKLGVLFGKSRHMRLHCHAGLLLFVKG